MKKSNVILMFGLVFTGCYFTQFQRNTFASEAQKSPIVESKTVEVIIRLEGKTVDGNPKVVPADNAIAALHEKFKDSVPLKLEKTGKNTWRCNAVEGKEYVIGWIAKKGMFEKRSKMFGYCSEPFTAKVGLTVEFSPGMPAAFEYDLRNPPEGVMAIPAKVFLLRETIKDGKQSFLSWGGKGEIENKGILKISGIASGKYKISAEAKEFEIYHKSHTPFLHEERDIEIKPGTVNRFEPNYPEIDSTIKEGDVTIRGTLYGQDKRPLANRAVKVIALTDKGFDLSLYYPESKTDSDGRFEFVGIRPDRDVYVSYENTSILLAKQSLTKNASISVDIVVGLKILPVIKGQPLQELIIDWKDAAAGKLSDLKGKIVVLDVWATWCVPCVKAFSELNSLAVEFSKNEDVVFIALSKDSNRAVWEKTVNESSWNALKHGWLDTIKNNSVFDKPIPYTVIIDKNGIIRAEGNGLDIKSELEKLDD